MKLFLLFILFSSNVYAFIPERRSDTIMTKPGYLVVPVFGDIPGVGTAWGLGLLDANILDSRTTLGFSAVYGNVAATALDLSNIYFTDHLVFEFTAYGTKLGYQVFDRGGFSSQTPVTTDNFYEYGGQAIASLRFWEKRIQFFMHYGPSKFQTYDVSDSGGDVFFNSDNSFYDTVSTTYGVELDLTDSLTDPRRGLRIEANRNQEVIFDSTRSQFYDLNLSTTAYIPIGNSTLALNYLRSSAVITQYNNMTQAELQTAMSLNCGTSNSPANCNVTQNQRTQERFTENLFGTATALGGTDRMRGFVQDRFKGSQAQFFGSEFRWNITNEGEPFNYGFMKGVRSNLQLAFFYEIGAVSDPPLAVEEAPLRSDYGVGFRVLFSGLVVRGDVGFSTEGTQLTFFFGYPWAGILL